MIGALVVPALVLITGFLWPWLRPDAAPSAHALLNHWLARLFLFVVISLSLFHWAFRFRYLLFDLGIKGGRPAVAAVCYGIAVVGTIVAGLVALHLV